MDRLRIDAERRLAEVSGRLDTLEMTVEAGDRRPILEIAVFCVPGLLRVAAAARVLLLAGGRLLYDGPAAGLVERARGAVFETMIDDAELRDFSHRYQVTTRVRKVDGIRVRAVVPADEEPPGPLVEPNLEEAYLAIMSRQGGRERPARRRAKSLLDLGAWRRD